MTIELTGIVVKHERRLRLVFSSALAAGAFGTPAPAAYVVDNEDGRGPSPGVAAAIIVASATANVELALDTDLVRGALYRITAIGIVGTDASSSTSASDQLFRFGEEPRLFNVEPKVLDADLLLYGRDCVWTGTDYLETAEGDLATVGGIVNVKGALRRRLVGSPLPWAPGYSPRARQFVDAPISSIGGLRGSLQAQAMLDDRVKSVVVRLVLDDTTPDESYFEVTPTFIGATTTGTDAVDVPIT
jgi:hypothetical protein